jgi:hypothetical protein
LYWLIQPDEAFIGSARPEPIMTTRSTKKISSQERDPMAAFVSKKAEIDAMLARLQALSADHFGWSPDEITWSHLGTLEHYAMLLKRITDSAFKEGEHAG